MKSGIIANKFCTNEELKIILESRNLFVDDIDVLIKVNYSHLIYKYGKFYFSTKNNKSSFKDGTRISHIYKLYLFNNQLSSILFKFILKFEHKLKRSIAYNFGQIDELCYKKENFFLTSKENDIKEIKNLISELNKIEENSKNKYNSKSYFNGFLPIWLLVDELNFSQLRMLLRFSNRVLKKEIHKDLNINPNNRYLLSIIHNFRNLLFHANPLKKKIKNKKNNENKKINYELSDLIKYMMSSYREEFQEFQKAINTFDYETINLKQIELINYLGLDNLIKNKKNLNKKYINNQKLNNKDLKNDILKSTETVV